MQIYQKRIREKKLFFGHVNASFYQSKYKAKFEIRNRGTEEEEFESRSSLGISYTTLELETPLTPTSDQYLSSTMLDLLPLGVAVRLSLVGFLS